MENKLKNVLNKSKKFALTFLLLLLFHPCQSQTIEKDQDYISPINKNSIRYPSILKSNFSNNIWKRIDSLNWNYTAHILKIRKSNNKLLVGYWGNGAWQLNQNTLAMKTIVPYSYADPWLIEDLLEPDINNIYIGVDPNGYGGYSFNYQNNIIQNINISGAEKFFVTDNTILLSTWDVLLKSTNNGRNWITIMNQSSPEADRIWSFCKDSSGYIYFGGQYGIYKTNNILASPIIFDTIYSTSNIFISNNPVYSMLYNNKEKALYATTTTNGLIKTTDGGTTWKTIGFVETPLHSIYYDSVSNLYFVGVGDRLSYDNSGGVYIGNGIDEQWRSIGLDNFSIQSLLGDSIGNIYAGVVNYGVWELTNIQDSIVIHDTTIVHDTTTIHDTIKTIHDSITIQHDTVFHDTTIVIRDSVPYPVTHDSIIIVHDSIPYPVIYDSLITKLDTILIHDTMIVDTCLLHPGDVIFISCLNRLDTVHYTGKTTYLIMPNPIMDNQLKLMVNNEQGERTINFDLCTSYGQIINRVQETLLKGKQIFTFDIPSILPSGVYYLVIHDDMNYSLPLALQFIIVR